MQFPKPDPGAVALFESVIAGHPELVPRKMFGHPAAFVQGNLCVGTFGKDVFLRLGAEDVTAASRLKGVRPFEPMQGRPMKGYLVFPSSVLGNRAQAARWVTRSIDHTASLPPK